MEFWEQYTKNLQLKKMNKEYTDIDKLVKRELSDFLGIDPEDIEDDYLLTEELHMTPTDLTDFTEILSKKFDVSQLDFTEIETYSELIDYLTLHQ